MPYVIEDKISFLSSAGKILSSSLDYNVALVSVAKLVVEYIADFCMIDLFEENGDLKRVTVKMHGYKKDRLAQRFYNYPPDPSNEQAIYDAAKLGYPVIIKKVTNDWLHNVSKLSAEKLLVKKLGFKTLMFVPLVSRNKIIGVLTIASTEKDFFYTREDAIFIKEVADRAAIAVDNARLYKEARDALEHRDQFLAIASHELKTPLTSILLSLQLVLNKLQHKGINHESSNQMEYAVKVAINKSRRMSDLIKDFLNVSQTSSRYFQLYKEPVRLSGLLLDVRTNFDLLLLKKNIKLTIKEEDKNIVGRWDRIRLEQAISNIILNAIKYGQGNPISIRTKKEDKNVLIKVKDKGVGISKEEKDEIFGVFKRGKKTKKTQGIGVGLFIAYRIIRAHNGVLSVKSKAGKGSEFTIQLPLK
jgi:signal transduction histidine kinase